MLLFVLGPSHLVAIFFVVLHSECEQLFRTLTHGAPEYRDSVHQWYQGRPDFQNLLNASLQMLGIAMNPNAVGLNHDLDARLTLMGGRNFAHEYANSITFKGMFIFLSKYCSENNWPLLNKVTPTNSPGRRGRGQGGGDAGGNANGGGDEAGGNAGDGGGAAPVEA